MADSYMTLKDVAELLKLSEKTLYRLAQQGEVPGFKIGGSWRFSEEDIKYWIAKQKDEAAKRAEGMRS